MDTVKVKGWVYQIGGLYLDGESNTGYLIGADEDIGSFKLSMNGTDWFTNRIETSDHQSGTITEAPIELEDGEWYMCEGGRVLKLFAGALYLTESCQSSSLSSVEGMKPLYKMAKA